MKTRLKEGQIIKSICFEKGNMDENGLINVVDCDNECNSVEPNRKNKEYKILKIYEYIPQTTSLPPFNNIIAIELYPDGSHDEKSIKISFSTMRGVKGAIDEQNIEILK